MMPTPLLRALAFYGAITEARVAERAWASQDSPTVVDGVVYVRDAWAQIRWPLTVAAARLDALAALASAVLAAERRLGLTRPCGCRADRAACLEAAGLGVLCAVCERSCPADDTNGS